MLQTMRNSAKYIWLFVVATFVVGFLLYQSSGLFGRSPITPTTAIATVNGEDVLVTQWQKLTQQLEQQATQGSGRSASLDERRGFEQEAYDQLINDVLLSQEIRRRGITVTDDEIIEAARYNPPPQLTRDPELQTDGQFDIAKYQRLISSPQAAQSGVLSYLETVYRSEIPQQKLYEQIAAGVYPSDGQLWQFYRDTHDSAQITYAAVRPTAPDPSINVSESEIRAYYDAHTKGIERPGHAVVTFTMIPRAVSAADSAAVRNHALALRQRILGGEKFDDVAKSESVDSASAINGGDLGKSVAKQYVAPFAQAAEALKPGEISEPVLTQFGYHLIRLDSRNGDTLALHHILLRIAQSDSAAARTDRKADSLSRIGSGAEHKTGFDSAVKLLNLTTSRADVVEGTPLTINGRLIPSVSAWAFSGAKPGESSDLFDDDNGYYLARLESVTAGGTPSLESVKNDIRLVLLRQKQLDGLVAPAEKLATAAAASSLEQAATVLNAAVAHAGPFTRLTDVPGIGSVNEVIGAAFTLPVGAISAPIKTDDAVYVIRVDRRVEANRAVFDSTKKALRQQRSRGLQQDRVRQFLANLRKSAKIKDRRPVVMESLRHSET